jgi:A/G-specific adenine glycosylase
MRKLSAGEIRKFRKSVYDYYRAHGRHSMPWRHAITPYRVLVSEIMLQQTQVDRVTSKFDLFMKRFPTIEALAGAPMRDVLGAWQGLGYNRRALALQRTSQKIMLDYHGEIPSDPAELRTCAGIGPATAASIAAFAFNTPVLFIETNIRAVYIHTFLRIDTRVSDDAILSLLEQTLDRNEPRRWYYALMDYGSMLKKKHPNPSRRSAHYSQQSAFEGSDRQVRGRLLRLFLKHNRITPNRLRASVPCESKRLEKIISGLVKDGFIQKARGGDVYIPAFNPRG